jgi:hypothetical protein
MLQVPWVMLSRARNAIGNGTVNDPTEQNHAKPTTSTRMEANWLQVVSFLFFVKTTGDHRTSKQKKPNFWIKSTGTYEDILLLVQFWSPKPNRPAMNKRGSSRETAGVLFGFQNSAIVFPRSWTNHQKLIVFSRPNRHKRLCQRKWKIQQLKAGQSSGIMTKIQNSIITSWGHFMKTSRDI